jgi:hypothetical protein
VAGVCGTLSPDIKLYQRNPDTELYQRNPDTELCRRNPDTEFFHGVSHDLIGCGICSLS